MKIRQILSTLILALLLLTALADGSRAQVRRYSDKWGAVTWSPSWSVSDTHDYIGKWSWRAFSVEGRQQVQPRTTVGVTTGWTTFNEKSFRVATEGTLTVTGTQNRYVNVFPLLVGAHLYSSPRGQRRYYVGLNVGTYYIERRTEVGIFALEDQAWHFGLAPEVGAILPWGSNGGLVFVRYNHAFATGSTSKETWISAGIGFRYH
jgi:hypothetical protein